MEQSVHRPLIKSGLFGWPSRQFRNPPSGRDCCASSVAAPLARSADAEMEGLRPSKPPHESLSVSVSISDSHG